MQQPKGQPILQNQHQSSQLPKPLLQPKQSPNNLVRIQKFIANNSTISRRKAEEMLLEGKIFLNGEKVTKAGTLVDPLKDIIEIEGERLSQNAQKLYLAMNKPAGYVTTQAHFTKEKSVMALLSVGNVYPAGRLDKDTEGLLIFTNDGEFANRMMHPKFEHDKEYIVHIDNPLTREKEVRITNGIILDGKKTAPCTIKDIKKVGPGFSLHIILSEGRKRQIKRMFDYVGCSVIYLQRIRIGKIHLGSLKSGEVRSLTGEEIKSI